MLITWLAWLLAFFTLLGMLTFATILVLAIMMYRFFRDERLKDVIEAEDAALDFKIAVMTQIDEMFQEFSTGEEK